MEAVAIDLGQLEDSADADLALLAVRARLAALKADDSAA